MLGLARTPDRRDPARRRRGDGAERQFHYYPSPTTPIAPRVRLSSTATPFAANSIWNAQVAANAPLAPDSSALVRELERQVLHYGTWINTTSYSTPIYTVPASQPRVPVPGRWPDGLSVGRPPGRAFSRPACRFRQDARPAPGTDADLVVWQPSTDTMWEMWNARRVGSTWHARWGGRLDRVSHQPRLLHRSAGLGYRRNEPGAARRNDPNLRSARRPYRSCAGHFDSARAERRRRLAGTADRREPRQSGRDSRGDSLQAGPALDLSKLKPAARHADDRGGRPTATACSSEIRAGQSRSTASSRPSLGRIHIRDPAARSASSIRKRSPRHSRGSTSRW